MTYFNPRIYNKQNLKEKDRKELEYWKEVFDSVIENAKEWFVSSTITDIQTIDNLLAEVAEEFCEYVRADLGYQLQDNVVSIIDNYEGDIEEVEEPETFLYNQCGRENPRFQP